MRRPRLHRPGLPVEELLVVASIGAGARARPGFRIRTLRAVVQYESGEVVFARPAARRLQVVPDRPGRSLDAVEEVGVSVQRLSLRELARGELAEELDVGRRRERLEHRSHLVFAACAGQFARRSRRASRGSCGARGRRRPRRACRLARGSARRRACVRRGGVAQAEADRLAERPVRPPDCVAGDGELPFDVARIDTGRAARHARYHRPRPQVYEHVPRLAQDHRLLTVQPVRISDCDRSFDGAHDTIVRACFTPARPRPRRTRECAGRRRPRSCQAT
jgi:hypothetical protein